MRVSCDLSIIIVNWNTRALLQECLDSLQREFDATKCLNVETIVVDNASSDRSVDMVRECHPFVLLIENSENIGFARANNQAIRRSQGRYIMLLNSDTVVHNGALNAMVGFADIYPEIGVLGPHLIDRSANTQLSWAKFPTLWSEMMSQHRRDRKQFKDQDAFEVDWLAGACLLVRRVAIEQVGLMDERFFLYSEETDWCKRIQDAGWVNVYYPTAVVSHFEGSSSSQDLSRSRFLLYHSKVLYADKHFGTQQARLLKWVFILSSPIKATWALLHGHAGAASGHIKLLSRLLQMPVRPTKYALND